MQDEGRRHQPSKKKGRKRKERKVQNKKCTRIPAGQSDTDDDQGHNDGKLASYLHELMSFASEHQEQKDKAPTISNDLDGSTSIVDGVNEDW